MLPFVSSRDGSCTVTGSGRSCLLSLPDVYVSIEGPHLEIGSTTVDRAIDRVVDLDTPPPVVVAPCSVAVDIDVRIRIGIRIRRILPNLLQVDDKLTPYASADGVAS